MLDLKIALGLIKNLNSGIDDKDKKDGTINIRHRYFAYKKSKTKINETY